VAGKKLKSKSGWKSNESGNGNGMDDFGFSALPGGGRFSNGDFYEAGRHGRWWTATEYGSDYAYYRYMFYDNDYVYKDNNSKSYGLSVRCIMDD